MPRVTAHCTHLCWLKRDCAMLCHGTQLREALALQGRDWVELGHGTQLQERDWVELCHGSQQQERDWAELCHGAKSGTDWAELFRGAEQCHVQAEQNPTLFSSFSCCCLLRPRLCWRFNFLCGKGTGSKFSKGPEMTNKEPLLSQSSTLTTSTMHTYLSWELFFAQMCS